MGKVENLRPYRPGESGNPAGRPTNKALEYRGRLIGSAQFYGLTRQDYLTWLITLSSVSVEQLGAIAADNEAPAMAVSYARAIVSDMNAGRTVTMDRIIDKLNAVWEQREKMQHESEGDSRVSTRIESVKKYIIKLLKKENKYTSELSMQVKIAAQLVVRTDMLAAELSKEGHQPVSVHISREGNARELISPKETLYLQFAQRSLTALRGLGMNFDSKERKGDDDSFGEFMRSFGDNTD